MRLSLSLLAAIAVVSVNSQTRQKRQDDLEGLRKTIPVSFILLDLIFWPGNSVKEFVLHFFNLQAIRHEHRVMSVFLDFIK